VASLTTPVASLASSVEWASIRGRAVTRDVTELAASVALHGLSLAIASEVVRATALVAAGSATTGEATAATGKATSEGRASSTATDRSHGSGTGSRAAPLFIVSVYVVRECKDEELTYGKVARLAARVAATVGSTTADAEGRAVSLNVTKTLAVVALLGCTCCKQSNSTTCCLNQGLLSVVLG
jgi:hypothetical protein